LIELLITIVIIGIVAVPFLNSFIQASNINVEARRLQNATLVAQDVAEEFKARPMSEILNSYQGPGDGKFDAITSVNYEFTNSAGENVNVTGYDMKNMLVTGASGEDFYVTVKMDPSAVVNADGEAINGALLPMFSNLYGGNTQIIFKQYVEPDSTIDKSKYNKTADIGIVCTEAATGEFTYNITLSIRYTNKDTGVTTDAITKNIEKKYSATEKHTVYLLAPIFDIISQLGPDGWGDYYCTDKINIKYEYAGTAANQKELTLYLAEQAKANKGNAEKLSRINPANVNITYVDNEGNSSTKNLNEYAADSAGYKLKLNSNIGKQNTGDTSEGSLTYDPNNIGKSLFLMTVEVRYGSKDSKVLTTFSTTKEE